MAQNTPQSRPTSPLRPDEEVWECQIKGRVYVEVTGRNGNPKSADVHGVGTRLRLSFEDRLRNQERIRDKANDPFVNGMLVRVDADQSEDESTRSSNALTADDLTLIFTLEQADFEEEVKGLTEVNVRRLKEMEDKVDPPASVLQSRFLAAHIQENYAVGGDTPTYREMKGEKD